MVCVADYSGGAAAAAVVARESAHKHTAVVGTSSAGRRIQRTGFLLVHDLPGFIPVKRHRGEPGHTRDTHTGKKTPGGF